MKRHISPSAEFIKGVPITVWLLSLVIIPLTFTFIMSFYSSEGLVIDRNFTLKNYKLFFTDPLYYKILFKSIRLALVIAIISLAASYPLAYMVSFKIERGKNLLFMLCIIPLWVSYLVRIIAWRAILGNRGVLNMILLALGVIEKPLTIFLYNHFAIAITLTYICIPFVFIPIYTSLEKIPRNLLDASNDLGANEFRAFTNVILPLSLPGLVTGFIFAFIIALGDYIIPLQLGGVQGIMFGNLIWSQFGFAFNWPLGAALGFVLFIISVTILGSTSKFGSTEGGFLGE
ncbi:ABC spermidine/putrescine transporter, inner membrane subunit [Candidatus Vecturithrix granuli]|uniref:ABC spermidine/putrescine transporter, inner membrane subunit n=1 Tax=Vecturithrix granuli TaxID=1499967 RepID=A0A081C5H6_VECG1|nr:ABC spermidine/putrescine transporter, inner membrane subunit [Candidatus Vecturithrix granuli]